MAIQRRQQRARAATGAGRVVRSLGELAFVRRVVDDELHLRVELGGGDEVIGPVPGQIEALERKTLVGTDDPTAEVLDPLDQRQTDHRIDERVPAAAGPPRGVRLERRGPAGLDLCAHGVECGADRPEVRREHDLRQDAGCAARRERRGELCRAEILRVGHRRVGRP